MDRTMSLILLGLHNFLPGVHSMHPFNLVTIDYAEYHHNPETVMEAFGHAMREDGIIQMVSVPDFAALRAEALVAAQTCLIEAPNAHKFEFRDGTTRRTLAAAVGQSMGQQEFDHGSESLGCKSFDGTGPFRNTMSKATDAFVKLLSGLVDGASAGHADNNSAWSGSIAEAVRHGDRLEHFHSYQVTRDVRDPTIQFHVDHGLFIAFVPALMIDGSKPSLEAAGNLLLRKPNGEVVEVELRSDGVVFMLGDGLNQMLSRCPMSKPLRAPSHAVRMPSASGLHRVWYGIMQLPPADSLTAKGLAFGDQRMKSIQVFHREPDVSEDILAWACSGGRRLHALASECNTSTQRYCWAQCLDFTPFVSPSACAAQDGLQMQCVNQFDQVEEDPSRMGDIWLVCTNSSTPYTPPPQVKQPTSCGANDWMVNVYDASYSNRVALSDETHFLWNARDGILSAKMVHKGAAGWLGFGFANQSDYTLNGMLGGKVVLGLNNPVNGTSVSEYHIDYQKTGFRWWNHPLNPPAIQNASLKVETCSISLIFATSSIYGQPINFTSTGFNNFIWALTHMDYPTTDAGGYAGYHADPTWSQPTSMYRGHLSLHLQPPHTSSAQQVGVGVVGWLVLATALRCNRS